MIQKDNYSRIFATYKGLPQSLKKTIFHHNRSILILFMSLLLVNALCGFVGPLIMN